MNGKITNIKEREYIFGPVPSRRLGRSLGIDLVLFKTCSYDCIYCQLGRTTNKTTQRKEWVPIGSVIEQLKEKLSSKPDYITLSGSGEPTLFSRIDELIFKIKNTTDIPVTVLTNGSLLWLLEVRSSLKLADLVIPSLDAGCNQIFQYVNRPHEDITFSKMLKVLVKFRDEYTGNYWLEVFLLAGVTTPEMEINRLKACINSICPDKVQINTVTRPPAEAFAERVPPKQLEAIAKQLYKNTEVIADYSGVHKQQDFAARCKNGLFDSSDTTILKIPPPCPAPKNVRRPPPSILSPLPPPKVCLTIVKYWHFYSYFNSLSLLHVYSCPTFTFTLPGDQPLTTNH